MGIKSGWDRYKVETQLKINDAFLIKAVKLIQDRQSSDEQEEGTIYKNNIGFNRDDGIYFADIIADNLENNSPVLEECRERMIKYSNQIANILNKKK